MTCGRLIFTSNASPSPHLLFSALNSSLSMYSSSHLMSYSSLCFQLSIYEFNIDCYPRLLPTLLAPASKLRATVRCELSSASFLVLLILLWFSALSKPEVWKRCQMSMGPNRRQLSCKWPSRIRLLLLRTLL